jgi:hypothetical protein
MGVLAFSSFADGAQGPGSAAAVVAVVLGSPNTEIAFCVTNTGTRPLPIGAEGTAFSPIKVTAPDGKAARMGYNADYTNGPPLLKPGETRTTRRRLRDIFDYLGFKDKGNYRLQWKLSLYDSTESFMSNELPIISDGFPAQPTPAPKDK